MYKIQNKEGEVIKEFWTLEECKNWLAFECKEPQKWEVVDEHENMLPGESYESWRALEYGDEIWFPFAKPEASLFGMRVYSDKSSIVNIKCTVELDNLFPREIELERGLSNRTDKATIVPVSEEDLEIYGTERSYFSDLTRIILRVNPTFFIKRIEDYEESTKYSFRKY